MLLNSVIRAFNDLPIWRFVGAREEHRSDWVNPICMTLLGIMSVFFIYSAESYSGGSSWKMQAVWLFIGFSIYGVMSFVNYKIYLENSHLIYAVGLVLLLLLFSPLGLERWGARRWLDLGKFTLQPSETAKITTLIMAASLLARSEVGSIGDSLKILVKVGVTFLLPMLLIFLQPDLGSSLVFPPMVFSLLFVSNLSQRFFVTVTVLFTISVCIVGADIYRYQQFLESKGITATDNVVLRAYEPHSPVPLKDYQRNRILAFVAPQVVDPRGNGVSWNLNQSLIAVAGGGFYGKGLGEGTQAKLGYLPPTVAPNDFIFSVLAEESGFIGGMTVIVLFAFMVINGIRIAGLARDRFGMLLAVGVSAILMVHIFVNIGMTIGLMPITGLPLPFVSYGGTFVLSCCVLQGLLQSVYRFRKDFT